MAILGLLQLCKYVMHSQSRYLNEKVTTSLGSSSSPILPSLVFIQHSRQKCPLTGNDDMNPEFLKFRTDGIRKTLVGHQDVDVTQLTNFSESCLAEFAGIRQKDYALRMLRHRLGKTCLVQECRDDTCREIQTVTTEKKFTAIYISQSFKTIAIASRHGIADYASP